MSRLRLGDLMAGVGGVGLFALMFFDWFGLDRDGLRHLGWTAYAPLGASGGRVQEFATVGSADGWSTLGWFMVVLLCVQIFGAAALVYMTIKRASPAWPIGAGVLTWTLGSLIWLVLAVRVCIAQPGPDALIAVKAPAYLGLLFSALIPLGGLLSVRDERTQSAESRDYMPPPARTAPGL